MTVAETPQSAWRRALAGPAPPKSVLDHQSDGCRAREIVENHGGAKYHLNREAATIPWLFYCWAPFSGSRRLRACQSERISRAASPLGSTSVTPWPFPRPPERRLAHGCAGARGADGFERMQSTLAHARLGDRRALIQKKNKFLVHQFQFAAGHLARPNIKCGRPYGNNGKIGELDGGERRWRFKGRRIENDKTYLALDEDAQCRRQLGGRNRANRQSVDPFVLRPIGRGISWDRGREQKRVLPPLAPRPRDKRQAMLLPQPPFCEANTMVRIDKILPLSKIVFKKLLYEVFIHS